MAPPTTADEKLDYVLTCLKNATFSIDYHATAEQTNCVNANKAQIKLKKFVSDSGKFKLVGGNRVMLAGEDETQPPPTPTKPRARGRPKAVPVNAEVDDDEQTSKPATKKRKVATKVTDKNIAVAGHADNEGDGGKANTVTKVPKTAAKVTDDANAAVEADDDVDVGKVKKVIGNRKTAAEMIEMDDAAAAQNAK